MIVNADMHELPADTACVALSGALAGDAVASAGEFVELLDVHMDELSRRGAFISHNRPGRFQVAPAAQTTARQNAPDRARGQALTSDRRRYNRTLRAAAVTPGLGHA